MNVQELREALVDFPDDANVIYDGDESGQFDTFVLIRAVFDPTKHALLLTVDGKRGPLVTVLHGPN